MNSYQKVEQLKSIIIEKLTPLINNDYYLLEVPYYTNIGDTLIWQGEMDFLRTLPYKCKGMYSLDTFTFPSIDKKNIILFQGGGNFGDLWTKHHDFKLSVVKHYKDNHFIFFPQTVYFENNENLIRSANFLSKYKNVTICARDTISFEILKKHFKNNILLIPDMAFCMNMQKWRPCCKENQPLLLKRIDKELKDSKVLIEVQQIKGIEVTDWPTMMKMDFSTKLLERMKYRLRKFPWIINQYCFLHYRPHLIRIGINLLMQHSTIYSTRLHAAILSILLNKPEIYFLDNSYGKNKSFFDTWLYDCDQIHFLLK